MDRTRITDTLGIRVSKSTARGSNLAYFRPEPTRILRGYPREEAVFEMIENDDGILTAAIGVIPETSSKNGLNFIEKPNGCMTVQAPKKMMSVGSYIMQSEPIFEKGIDWYLLERKQ